MIKIINIKKNMPFPDCAVYEMEKEIELSTNNSNALIVIHGYGSHGKGGVIKIEVINKLIELKNKGKIKNFFKGETWGDTNEEIKELKKLEPELILHPLLINLNSGVTVVWLKNNAQ